MQLKNLLIVALVAVVVHETTSFIILGTAAAAGTALTIGAPTLAAIGGGALLLGAAGLLGGAIGASKGRRGRSHYHRGGYSRGYGGHGYRGRRSLTDAVIADDGFSANALDVLFATATAIDQETNCGARLVCELSARPVNQLAADEALLMSLFADQTPLNLDQVNDPSTPFQLAAFLGKNSRSTAACDKTYTKCKLNGTQIMEILRQNGNGQV